MRLRDISIDHPTDRPNFTIVGLETVSLAFSYQTLVGVNFHNGNGWKVRENVWGPTTGGHLNYLNPDKGDRLSEREFSALVEGLEISEVNPV